MQTKTILRIPLSCTLLCSADGPSSSNPGRAHRILVWIIAHGTVTHRLVQLLGEGILVTVSLTEPQQNEHRTHHGTKEPQQKNHHLCDSEVVRQVALQLAHGKGLLSLVILKWLKVGSAAHDSISFASFTK